MKVRKVNNSIIPFKAIIVLSPLVFILLFLCQSCYEPQEGCLDVAATDFDPTADDACLDCCTYPTLNLNLSHQYGDSGFSYNTPYTVDSNSVDTFSIQKMRFYLSDFRFENDNGIAEINDTLAIETVAGEQFIIKDNFVLVSRDNFSYVLGDFRSTGEFDTLRFLVGLDLIPNETLPASVDTDHALAITSDSTNWNDGTGYVFNEIILDNSLNQMDTLNLLISGNTNLIEVKIPYAITIDFGRNITIPLKIDYQKWMEGINFVVDTEQKIMEDIVNNTTKVFSIIE